MVPADWTPGKRIAKNDTKKEGEFQMNAIKNYLENMFLNLPKTPEVIRAKEELLSMMEDRYHELIADGKAENEAVGVVISEFGNLEELANELGIGHVLSMQTEESQSRRMISMETIRNYLKEESRSAFLTAAGIFLIVASSVPQILLAARPKDNAAGVILLLVLIAVGIVMVIYGNLRMGDYSFIRKELFAIDFGTEEYVRSQYAGYRNLNILEIVIGVALCILCSVPSVLLALSGGRIPLQVGPAITLLMVAIAVFLFVLAGRQKAMYQSVLRINRRKSKEDVHEMFPDPDAEDVYYENKYLRFFMSVYWPTVTVIYLVWSFATFHWGITWIVWPIAGIAHGMIQKHAKEAQYN